MLLWRCIKKHKWDGKDPDSPNAVKEAGEDFRLRGGEPYLSFYEVADEQEGRRVAAAFKVTGHGKPDKIDFMLFARQSLSEAGIELEPRPDESLPDFLSVRHLGTRGPRHEPSDPFIKQLLRDSTKLICRMKEKEIVHVSKELIEEIPGFQNHLGEHWRSMFATDR